MESAHIINSIKRTKYISLITLTIFILSALLLFTKIFYGSIFPIYFPNQEKIINISKYKHKDIAIVLEAKYKDDFQIDVLNESGRSIRVNSTYNGQQNEYISGYAYYYDASQSDKVKIKITNKTNKFILTKIGGWQVFPIDWKRI